MSAESAPGRLTLLLVLAGLLLAGSGVSYYLLQVTAAAPAGGMPVAALYETALDANAAASGEPQAFARFQQSQKALEDAAAREASAPFASDARFTRLMSNATALLRARAALSDAAAAAHDTATLVPRLTSEARALAVSLPPASASAASGALERFETRAQRLQLDVTALTQGATDPAQAAQRIAESSEYLGQVIAGFAGGSSALGLPHVTTPESAKHLKNLNSLYSDLAAAVKRAVAAAPALPAAQTAAHAIVADARLTAIVSSLAQDFLPSSWGIFQATRWDWATYVGTIGLFLFLFFAFIRLLPMISIFEVRTLLPQAKVEEEVRS